MWIPRAITLAPIVGSRDQGLACVISACIHALIFALMLEAAGNGTDGISQDGGSADQGLMVTYITIPPDLRGERTRGTTELTIANPVTDQASDLSSKIISELHSAMAKSDVRISVDNLQKQSTVARERTAEDYPNEDGALQNDLLASYQTALRHAIQRKWDALSDRRFPAGCTLHLKQGVGGTVAEISTADCSLAEEDRLRLEAATLMAQPLPYSGYESVFVSDLNLTL